MDQLFRPNFTKVLPMWPLFMQCMEIDFDLNTCSDNCQNVGHIGKKESQMEMYNV